MGEPEDIDVESGEDVSVEDAPAEGFSIGKLIEWLLANMIPVIVAVVLSTIVALIIFNSHVSKKSEEQYETTKLQPKPAPLSIFPLGSFKLNTADVDETHFVRLTLSIGYNDENKKLTAELSSRKTQLRDIVLRIIGSKEKSDIDEPRDKELLKQEIKKSINNVLINGEVEAVYYDEFVIS